MSASKLVGESSKFSNVSHTFRSVAVTNQWLAGVIFSGPHDQCDRRAATSLIRQSSSGNELCDCLWINCNCFGPQNTVYDSCLRMVYPKILERGECMSLLPLN